MKVYAEYFIEANGKEFRRKTLLCFGNSAKLIGSAVLMNPGSANPEKDDPDINLISSFYNQNHSLANINPKNWKKFRCDSTMQQLEKIFNGGYIANNEPKNLNGIIQLFNCFYYKNPNLDTALENLDEDSEYNFNEKELFLNKPVYFGWGSVGKEGKLKNIANRIFSEYELKNTPIYDPEFSNNCFYHPGYINRSYKTNKGTVKLLRDFHKLF